MTVPLADGDTVPALDAQTVALVRLAARITAGDEAAVRSALGDCVAAHVSESWLEELVLQSYLFAGFPRALNAAREWRRLGGHSSGPEPSGADVGSASYIDAVEWRTRGEETCKTVYGANYDKLRANIRWLHPALDEWMIVEGYGKVLSRPGLDLVRRELCIVAACTAAAQDRQLQSHLHGALNAGAAPAQVAATLHALRGAVRDVDLERAQTLWGKVLRVPR
jgi:4-carboxymuconolactone decarboxylase